MKGRTRRKFKFGDARLPERFWAKVRVDRESGCWLWTAHVGRHGYGQFGIWPKSTTPHRWAYLNLVGPVPDGLELDHLCRVRHCCNPAHLEPVTHRENNLRGLSPLVSGAHVRARTHCPKGHPYAGSNLMINSVGGRQCKICRREQGLRSGRRKTDARTHCPQGHPLSGKNLRLRSDGKRYCVKCRIAMGCRLSRSRPRVTHCKSGHPFEGDNLFIAKTGQRMCRTCRRVWNRQAKQRARMTMEEP